MKSVHVFVSGRVQGVFFRLFTQKIAKRLGLTGWVKNLNDGRVEVWAEGPADKLRAFLKDMERGPLTSKVTDLKTSWGAARGLFSDFDTRATE